MTKALSSVPAHERQRRHFDDALFHVVGNALVGQHVRQGIVKRLEVGVELFLEIPRQEAEVFTGLHCRARQDDFLHATVFQRGDRHRDSSVGFARARGSHREDLVVLPNGLHQPALVGRAGRHFQSPGAVDDDVVMGGILKEGRFLGFGQAINVVFPKGVVAVHMPNHHPHHFSKRPRSSRSPMAFNSVPRATMRSLGTGL